MRGHRRIHDVALVAALAACGGDDASDEAIIERILDDVTGKIDAGYVDRALAHVDVARYGIDVRVAQHAGVHDTATAPALFDAFRTAVSERFLGDTFKRRATHVTIEGDAAEVELGLVTRFGPGRVSLTLRRSAPGVWKITRVYVDR